MGSIKRATYGKSIGDSKETNAASREQEGEEDVEEDVSWQPEDDDYFTAGSDSEFENTSGKGRGGDGNDFNVDDDEEFKRQEA